MSVTRLSGGLTPGVGGDPRTFPAIWNDTADAIDSLSIGTAVASGGQVLAFSTAVSGYVPEDVFGGAVNGTAVYRFVDTVYFTSSGTFAKADYPWLRAIRVKVQAGGGGGGGVSVSTGAAAVAGGGGGGGGGYVESFITDIAGLDASVTVTRGGGGAAGTINGADGVDSSFGSIVAAHGEGGGGQSATGGVTSIFAVGGLAGFPAAGPDLVIPGGGGGHPFAISVDRVYGGAGGSSALSAGAQELFAVTTGLVGRTSPQFGGGGGGAALCKDQTAKTGGAGANGIVIVELYA